MTVTTADLLDGPRRLEQPPVLALDGVGKRYGDVRALDDVSLEVRRGELLSVVGPSGCGKSTLLRAVAGLIAVDAGHIFLEGREVASRRTTVPPERRGVAVVFQDLALFPHLSVRGNVSFGLRGRSGTSARTAEMLDLVSLGPLADRYPHELSGGEQQRVALARALAPDPSVVLLDEPFSHLDRALAAQVREEASHVLRAAGATVVLVTHDQDEALGLGDRVAVLSAGRLQQVGSPADVFHAPASRFVATFLGEADFLPGYRTGGTVATGLGDLQAVGDAAPSQGEVEVMVRPHDLWLQADDAGTATVLRSEFRGGTMLQHVRLADGTVVRVSVPHVAATALGARVHVHVQDDHPLVALPATA